MYICTTYIWKDLKKNNLFYSLYPIIFFYKYYKTQNVILFFAIKIQRPLINREKIDKLLYLPTYLQFSVFFIFLYHFQFPFVIISIQFEEFLLEAFRVLTSLLLSLWAFIFLKNIYFFFNLKSNGMLLEGFRRESKITI